MTELYLLNPLAHAIQKLTIDTMQLSLLVMNLPFFPDDIIVDPEKKYMYWTNMGKINFTDASFYESDGSIERCTIDGTHRTTIIPPGATCTPKQLTADWVEGKLYWCDREGVRIWRANLDGSDQELLLDHGSSEEIRHTPTLHCVGIALDLPHQKIYWTQKGNSKGGEGRIFRMNLTIPEGETASHRSDIETLWENLPEPIDLYLHSENQILYWTDRGQEPEGNTLNAAPIPSPGTLGEKPEILLTGFNEAIGIDYDPLTHTLYATDLGGNIYYYSLTEKKGGLLTHLKGTALTGIAVVN